MAALPVDDDATPAPRGPQVGGLYPLPDLPQKEIKRRRRIDETWKAYRGEWGAGPLKVQPGDPDDNVKPNVCQPIVDVGVNFLFGEVVKIEVSNEKDDKDAAADAGDSSEGGEAQTL